MRFRVENLIAKQQCSMCREEFAQYDGAHYNCPAPHARLSFTQRAARCCVGYRDRENLIAIRAAIKSAEPPGVSLAITISCSCGGCAYRARTLAGAAAFRVAYPKHPKNAREPRELVREGTKGRSRKSRFIGLWRGYGTDEDVARGNAAMVVAQRLLCALGFYVQTVGARGVVLHPPQKKVPANKFAQCRLCYQEKGALSF